MRRRRDLTKGEPWHELVRRQIAVLGERLTDPDMTGDTLRELRVSATKLLKEVQGRRISIAAVLKELEEKGDPEEHLDQVQLHRTDQAYRLSGTLQSEIEYVLGTLKERIRKMDRPGRPISVNELTEDKLAEIYYHWREIGYRMGWLE